MFLAQQQIGPYTLIRRLGQGGFGEVWLAEKRGSLLTSQVALKLPLDPDPDLSAVQQEARLWLQASGHPNVLPVMDAEVYEGQVVIVSEYAAGGSLASWLKQNGGKAPSVEAAIAMTEGILAGLEYLHALTPQPIIHRDLKPDNVLLQGGHPRLTDFGISRVLKTTAQTQHASGTPHYMPPEAFRGYFSPQTDLWAAGVMLYQMLSGALPFPQSDIASLYGAIFTEEPAPFLADVSSELKAVVMKALAKDPAQRFTSAAEMQADLKRAAAAPRQQRAPAYPGEDWILKSELAVPRTGEDAIDSRFLQLCIPSGVIGSMVAAWRSFEPRVGFFWGCVIVVGVILPAWIAAVFISLGLGYLVNSLRRFAPYRTLTGHRSGIRSVAISADDHRIVTGSEDKTAKVWNAATGQEIFTLGGQGESILAVAISSDGTRIVTCSGDETVTVWDAETGSELRTFRGSHLRIGAAALSADGRRMVTVGDANTGQEATVHLWDIDTGQLCLTLAGQTRSVTVVALSSDGKRIVTGDRDNTVKVWDAVTGKELHALKGHGGVQGIVGIALSLDGKRIVSASGDSVRVWDAITWTEIWNHRAHAGSVHAVAISGDGRYIVIGSRDRMTGVWEVAAKARQLTLKGHNGNVDSAVIAADGRCIVTGSKDNTAKLWIVPSNMR